ncbi:MAG: sigma-70 family RNA polymerase sigma factor [Phycisphaerales bacterium]|nr:MAG: sigma-70 family RNA polymerase sigma factor [Phycisphaerales bacterium]
MEQQEHLKWALMFGRSVSYDLTWDPAVCETVHENQKWVLSVMQRHGQELVTMLWRILGNEQDVCDAYQSTFLQLAHCQDTRRPHHIKAYVFRTANNVAISMLRRRLSERQRLSTAGPREATGSPAGELDAKYLQESLRYCIARLPEHLRSVIALRDLAELSYVRIGKMLGISPATARVYRCKAIHLLATWMRREREERQ